MKRNEITDILVALAVLLTVRLGVLWVSPYSLGSADLQSWADVGNLLMAGRNPYALTDRLNWPPFWMQIVYVLSRFSIVTGINFGSLVKLFLTLVECVLVVAMYLAAKRLLGVNRPLPILILAICANPVALFLVMQHCNFDVLIGLWILLFYWSTARFAESGKEHHWLLASLFLGLAIWTKTVPLCLLPITLFGIRGIPRSTLIVGFFLIFSPVTIATSVIYVLAPSAVAENVFLYRSAPGCFGISGILHSLDQQGLADLAKTLFPIAYSAALVYTGHHLWHRESISKATLLRVTLLLLVSIPVLGPGYASQYVYWYLPLLALLYYRSTRRTRKLLVVLHCVMVATYIIEYTLFHTHGLLLLYLVREETVDTANLVSLAISTGGGQTLVRLPLFVVYLVFLAHIVQGLRDSVRQDADTDPPSSAVKPASR